MASNFAISVSRNNRKNITLKLNGDFDGSSAYGLIHLLKDNLASGGRIVIDTDGLKNVNSFGLNVFRTLVSPLRRKKVDIVYTGLYESTFEAD